MIDAFGLPQRGRSKTWFFGPTGSTIAQGVQVWQKPKNASGCFFVVWGGGGGGGAGYSRTVNTAGAGGGGGACSGIARFLVPAIFVPERLFIQVGQGGQGGVPGIFPLVGPSSVVGGSGSDGGNTYISTCPPLTAGTVAPLPNIWLNSGVNAPGGGYGGGPAGLTGGGIVPTIAVVQPHHLYGQWSATVGLVGAAGGSATGGAGTSVTAWASNCFTPGAGGGGEDTADQTGGRVNITARLSVPGALEIASGNGNFLQWGLANGGNGNAFPSRLAPFLNAGGSGGGTDNDGQGGQGAPGGYGCGGGGGGAGTTGGNGGNGGPGGAVIVCW